MSSLPTYVHFLWNFYYFDDVPRNLCWFELLLQEGELTITTFLGLLGNFHFFLGDFAMDCERLAPYGRDQLPWGNDL